MIHSNPTLYVTLLNLAIIAASVFVAVALNFPFALLALFLLKDIPIIADQPGASGAVAAEADDGEPIATDHRIGFHAALRS